MTHNVGGSNGVENSSFYNANGVDAKKSEPSVKTDKLSTDPNDLHQVHQEKSSSVDPQTFKENIPPAEMYEITEVYEQLLTTFQVLESTLLLLANESANTQVNPQIEHLRDNIRAAMLDIAKEQSQLDSSDQVYIQRLDVLFKDYDRLDRKCDDLLTSSAPSEEAPNETRAEYRTERKPLEAKTVNVAENRFVDTHKDTSPLKSVSSFTQEVDLDSAQLIGNGDIESIKGDEVKLAERGEKLLSVRNELESKLKSATGENQTLIRSRLDILGKEYLKCVSAFDDLFTKKLSSESRDIKKTFQQLQALVGKEFSIPAELKLSLLTFLKIEGSTKSFNNWISKSLKTKNQFMKELNKGLVPSDSAHYGQLTMMFMEAIPKIIVQEGGAKKVNDLQKIGKIIGAKTGLEQIAQLFSDSLLLMGHTPEEIIETGKQGTELRYALNLVHNKSVPQSFSPAQERNLLEKESFIKQETGVLGQVVWERVEEGVYKMTFTMRVQGDRANSVRPQSFTSLLDLREISNMPRNVVMGFVEKYFQVPDKEACDKALKNSDLKELLKYSGKNQLVSDNAFWKWVAEGEKPPNTEFQDIKAQVFAQLKSLVAIASKFENDSMVKYVKANILLGQ